MPLASVSHATNAPARWRPARTAFTSAVALSAILFAGKVQAQASPPPAAARPTVAEAPAATDKPTNKVAAKAAPTVDDGVMRYPPSSVRLPLILSGAALTGAAYGLGVMTSRIWQDVPGSDMMVIPVAGPWIALAQNECSADSPDCGTILIIRGALLVLDGLAQIGGLAVIGEGLFMTTEADDPDKPAEDKTKTTWTVAPQVGPTQAGVSFVGTF